MSTEERLQRLEEQLAEHDRLISALIAYARKTPVGRSVLRVLGIS